MILQIFLENSSGILKTCGKSKTGINVKSFYLNTYAKAITLLICLKSRHNGRSTIVFGLKSLSSPIHGELCLGTFADGNLLRCETLAENRLFSCLSGNHEDVSQGICPLACLLLEGTILWRGVLCPQKEIYHSHIITSPHSQTHLCPGALSKGFHIWLLQS